MTDAEDLRGKLTHARERLEAANEAMRAADRKQEAAHEMGGGILGFGASGSQRAAQQVRAAHGSAYNAWKDASARIEKWSYRVKRLEARLAEVERVRYTASDLAGAVAVKDFEWHRVVKVNAKSVTVATPYDWTDRIPLDRITDFRK